MARQVQKLTARKVETTKEAGTYEDGGGLRLVVSTTGRRSWVLRYQLDGKRREMGLGAYPLISLADAREKAHAARTLMVEGKDPLAVRDREVATRKRLASAGSTVRAMVETFFVDHGGDWSPLWRRGWERKAELYVYPLLGTMPAAEVTVDDVVAVLRPLWGTKTRTAEEVRWLLERVLAGAKTRGLRTGDNPAVWQDGLDQLLDRSARKKARAKQNHPALPWQDMPKLMKELRAVQTPAAKALQLLILTASRSHMVRFARWDEFNLEAGVWSLPADRMKMREAFEVPLPAEAVELIRSLPVQDGSPYLLPGQGKTGVMHRNAMRVTLHELGRADVTLHGFRSSFRTWAGECTHYPRMICELALAHDIRSEVEGAYDRSAYLAKRRPLMQEWSAYLLG